jgi:hypothetical protein
MDPESTPDRPPHGALVAVPVPDPAPSPCSWVSARGQVPERKKWSGAGEREREELRRTVGGWVSGWGGARWGSVEDAKGTVRSEKTR